mmetsp:Transcript_44074/g.134179  ORF Transcript_44074/g.134179 Transcript_44074/m.134179 type:complete len:431 (-) Transcript_44074:84-1376(-)
MVAISKSQRVRWHRLYWYLILGFAILTVVFLVGGGDSGEYDDSYINPLVTASTTVKTAASSTAALASTTTVVEFNDPHLHESATVMAMATGYSIYDYQRFVGSLRKTGYKGNIILVVAPDIRPLEEEYLKLQNVTMHKVQHTKCTHSAFKPASEKDGNVLNSHEKELMTCIHPYPNLKHRWARFPLLRDLLELCGGKANPSVACGGPVLISDMRDTFFQRNPFGPEAPKVHGLQVFEEHFTITTKHWLVEWPVRKCKDVVYDKPMLCSGTTIGTREAMLDYLRIFHGEMDRWMADPKCHFSINGDDQSMHNYMYYSGMLDEVRGGVVAVKNRDGLVHTVGAMGSIVLKTHQNHQKLLRGDKYQGSEPFPLSAQEKPEKSKSWLGFQHGLTDKDGYFAQFDGSRSFVIHQYDRFGHNFMDWLKANAKDIYL